MKKSLYFILVLLFAATFLNAQVQPEAGKWKTWFIASTKDYRLPPPPSAKEEVTDIIQRQRKLNAEGLQQILYWNAGAPGYRWYNMMSKLWMSDYSTSNGPLANVLLSTAIYDATIAAWDTKYAFNRTRPYAADNRIKDYVLRPQSPSYPCEHSVAAGVAVTIISHFYPKLADSVNRMAQRAMDSRINAGAAFPSDTRAGFELGKKIAEKEIELTKDYITSQQFDAGKMPKGPGVWTGKSPLFPMAGFNKTIVLKSGSEFRPGPPPDFTKEMEELRNFKQTFRSKANAFHYASQATGDDLLTKKIFEYNLHLNPPHAARIYAAVNIAYYDAFVAVFDAKYAYWGIRPDQYDTTYTPLMQTPPFPGYPSGHAVMSGVVAQLFPYFFPYEKALFEKIGNDGAESRFHAGIHFRTDNEVGLQLGRKVAERVIEHVRADGAADAMVAETKKKSESSNNHK